MAATATVGVWPGPAGAVAIEPIVGATARPVDLSGAGLGGDGREFVGREQAVGGPDRVLCDAEHEATHRLGRLRRGGAPPRVGTVGLDDVACVVDDLVQKVRAHDDAVVAYGSCDKGHLQGRRRHVLLPDGRLHEARDVLGELGRRREVRGGDLSVGQVQRGHGVEAEGGRLVVELVGPEALAHLGERGVARVGEYLDEVAPAVLAAEVVELDAVRAGKGDRPH